MNDDIDTLCGLRVGEAFECCSEPLFVVKIALKRFILGVSGLYMVFELPESYRETEGVEQTLYIKVCII